MEACRAAVKEDLRLSKIQHFSDHQDSDKKVLCDITGELIDWSEAHLDHKKPMTFQVIVKTFLAANKITIDSPMLTASQDAQFTTEFESEDIKQKFIDYHHDVADLRIIKAKQNLSLGGSERITKSKSPVKIVKIVKKGWGI